MSVGGQKAKETCCQTGVHAPGKLSSCHEEPMRDHIRNEEPAECTDHIFTDLDEERSANLRSAYITPALGIVSKHAFS